MRSLGIFALQGGEVQRYRILVTTSSDSADLLAAIFSRANSRDCAPINESKTF
jgi:hypothetical protein